MPILARNGGRDEGNAALELVVLAPVLLFILGLVVAAGRPRCPVPGQRSAGTAWTAIPW